MISFPPGDGPTHECVIQSSTFDTAEIKRMVVAATKN